jgi:hypothetical protein
MQMKVFDRRVVEPVVAVPVVGMQIGCGKVLAQIGQTNWREKEKLREN